LTGGAQAPVLAVTGATGFIGGAIARRFAASGWRVKALVRVPLRAAGLNSLGVETVAGDLSQPDRLAALVREATAVVHCAGAVRGITDADFRAANVDGVLHLSRAVARAVPDVPLVLLSSLAARAPHLSPYAASKRAGEEALASAHAGLRWVALRPPAVYGPGDREMRPVLQTMMRGLAPAPGVAGARFSLLFVDDLVTAVERVLALDTCPSGPFELHDGRAGGYSWPEAASIVARLRGRPVRLLRVPATVLAGLARLNAVRARFFGPAPMLTPGKVRELTHPDWVCDNAPFTRATGWEPRVDFAEGLRRTLGAAA
jgi:nucleoside-diphosphate-sugar epimerase